MNALSIASRRLALARRATCTSVQHTTVRGLSSQQGHDAAGRLHDLLEEYRLVHYTQEIPRRFKKDIVTAACTSTSNKTAPEDAVCMEGLQQVLRNIGLNDRLSHRDLQIIFEEEGNEAGAIPANRMMQLL